MLQTVIFIAACVPIVAGVGGMIAGTSAFPSSVDVSLDSHFRYLSGLLCGLGLSFWILLPTIERQTATVRALTFMVVVGGFARLISMAFVATPSLPMQLALLMELIVTPLLCLWQTRIARMSANI